KRLKRRRASKSRRRSCFLKRSSRGRKSFSAQARLLPRIWIAPARHEIRTSGDLLKQTGVSSRKSSRHRNRAWFTTRCFVRANGLRQGNRSWCFYRRKTSRYARSFRKRALVQSITGTPLKEPE